MHIHLIPRKPTDFPPEDRDAIYPLLESSERALGGELLAAKANPTERMEKARKDASGLLVVPRDEDRHPRSEEEMTREAAWLGTFFTDE